MIFEYKKPRPGYFIDKIKQIEVEFRGDYLSHFKGKGRKKNSKFLKRKNPLENTDLPQTDLINMLNDCARTHNYNLRNLTDDESFSKDVIDLINIYIEEIELPNLKLQKEAERLEMNENSDFEEEKNQRGENRNKNHEIEFTEESEEFDSDEEELTQKEMKAEENIDIEFEENDPNTCIVNLI